MSFATCCPACATRFRVVADQLKISEGWVRCGQCGEVFDATQDLVAWSDSTWAAVGHSATPAAAVSSDDSLLQPDVVPPLVASPEIPAETLPSPEAPPFSDERADVRPDAPPDSLSLSEADIPVEDGWPAASPERTNSDATLAFAPGAQDDADLPPLPEPVGFVRQAQRRAWWQRRGVRASLAVLSTLLTLGLVLQWVIHERHRMAALRPDVRPVLDALCAPLGCRVEPLRWADALSIDSTTLTRRGDGRYVLEVVLRNASMFYLAMPALELSLTDARDQLLLRRVIMPNEMPGTDQVSPQAVLTLRLDVQIDASVGDALAGYRTVVFYP